MTSLPGVHADLIAAVDMAVDKVESAVRRYKQKIQDHRRTPSTGRVAGAPEAEEPNEE